MQKIIILDFSKGEVHIFPIEEPLDNAEDFFDTEIAEEFNLAETNCHYMITDAEVNIQLH
jgi:hypothetical protein